MGELLVFKNIAYFSLVLGFLFGSVAVYIAIDHNPQMTFYDYTNRRFDYKQLAFVFLSWCSIVWVLSFIIIFIIAKFLKR